MTTALKRILAFRCIVATALMIWCAGAGCMIVSYARAMSAEDQTPSAEPSMAGTSAAMDAHACCKAKHKALRRTSVAKKPDTGFTQLTTSLPARSNAMSCCPLTSGSLVVASRSQADDSTSDLGHDHSSALKLPGLPDTRVTVPTKLPNRARSYLLDCAFLI